MSQVQIRSEYGYKWEVLFLIRSKASRGNRMARTDEEKYFTIL